VTLHDPRDGRLERRGSLAGSLLRLLLALALVWLGGLLYFIHGLPRQEPDDGGRTDAIVVLTGGAERLEAGLALLVAERAERLFVSGVDRATTARDLEARSDGAAAKFACCVDLGHEAPDTVGNAEETARWMRQNDFSSLRLVTASYHMPRALVLFRAALPDTVGLLAHPVISGNVRVEGWWMHPQTARLLAGEFNKYLVSLLRVRLAGTG
jgi:uncharacterized SAM-binding protein YcdF (DUF218 family)